MFELHEVVAINEFQQITYAKLMRDPATSTYINNHGIHISDKLMFIQNAASL